MDEIVNGRGEISRQNGNSSNHTADVNSPASSESDERTILPLPQPIEKNEDSGSQLLEFEYADTFGSLPIERGKESSNETTHQVHFHIAPRHSKIRQESEETNSARKHKSKR